MQINKLTTQEVFFFSLSISIQIHSTYAEDVKH